MTGWVLVIGSIGMRQLPDVGSWEAVVASIAASEQLRLLALMLAMGILTAAIGLGVGWREAGRILAVLQEAFGAPPA
jgi:hypothetical protein